MPISVEEKQKSLYTALIRYSSDARSLRERSLDHLVLIALQNTCENGALRSGAIRKIIGRGIGAEGIRVEVVQVTLGRLIKAGLVKEVKIKHRPNFYITSVGSGQIKDMAKTSDSLMNPCIDRMIDNYEFNGNLEDVRHLCKRFIINSFVDYGQMMARCVTGDEQYRDISTLINAERTFAKSVAGITLDEEERNSLLSRCLVFLRSQNKSDIKVKFLLTQAFYLGKILEIEENDYDPLVAETFKDAVIFLDSNVVFESLFDDGTTNIFGDLSSLARRLNITFYVTRSTIEEIYRVLDSKIPALSKIVSNIPQELYLHTKDHIMNGFIRSIESSPELTPEDFIASLGDIPKVLGKYGIEYYDLIIEADIDANSLKETSKIVREAAETERGSSKTEKVSDHDAAHLLLVKKYRIEGKKSWFLTKDRTLGSVSTRMAGKMPLIFSVSSFVQCISPFVQGGDDSTLYQLFEKVLEEDSSLAGVGELFELSELQIISEYHQDLLATEPEQLTLAFDYVKSSYLNGNDINIDNQHKVHLKIKQFLKSGVEDQKIAMQNEIDRKREQARTAEEALKESLAEKETLQDENTKLEEEIVRSNQKFKLDRERKIISLYLPMFLFGLAVSLTLWIYDKTVYDALSSVGLIEPRVDSDHAIFAVRFFGSLIFTFFSIPLCLSFKNKEITLWTLVFIIVVSLYNLESVTEGLLSSLLNYIGVGLLFAGFIIWIVRKK